MSIAAAIKRAPQHALEDYVKEGRPKRWTCNRCGYKNKVTHLRCENGGTGPNGCACGGLGLQIMSSDGPEIYDMAKAEIDRRVESKKAKAAATAVRVAAKAAKIKASPGKKTQTRSK